LAIVSLKEVELLEDGHDDRLEGTIEAMMPPKAAALLVGDQDNLRNQDLEPPQGATSRNNCQQLENDPIGDLHHYINKGHDARSIMNARHEECAAAEGYRALDDTDRFSAFT
jgi:hypothetical protein